ncbi:MAG: isochorismatase family protein [Lutibacter sp.]|jgi:hypothetical protein
MSNKQLLVICASIILFMVGVALCVPHVIKKINLINATNKDNVCILFMDVWNELPWSYDRVDELMELQNIDENEAKHRIDVWLEWWNKDVAVHSKNVIVPLLKFVRENNLEIIFSRNGVDLLPELENLIYKEPIINLSDDLDAYLKGKGLKTIYYAGYATNNCVWGNSTGMKNMAWLGYNVILIKDASLPIPYQVLTYEEVLVEISKVGEFITVKEFMEKYQ